MRKWARVGIISLAALLLVAATATGVYALASKSNPNYTASLPGIPLVKPALAQGEVTFPDPDAGLSAYVKMDAGDIDFDALVNDLLHDGARGAGANYAIGTIDVPQPAFEAAQTVPVHVYVDTDGWRVAYLLKDEITSELFTYTNWDPTGATGTLESQIFTVQEEALRRTTDHLGETLDLGAVNWYYWADPAATRLGAAARSGQGNLSIQIPAGATLYGGPSETANPSYSFNSQYGPTGTLTLTCTDGLEQTLSSGAYSEVFDVEELGLPGDVMCTFNVSGGFVDGQRFGTAVIYSVP